MARTRHIIGTVATDAGGEWRPLDNWPSRRIFLSSDNLRALAVMYYITNTNVVRLAWSQSQPADYYHWSAITEIDTLSIAAAGLNSDGWQDAANRVYVVYAARGTPSNALKFVKLTYASAAGWSPGAPVVIVASPGAVENVRIVKDSTGRLWVVSAIQGSNVNTYYSDSDGATWTAGPAIGTYGTQSGPPLAAIAWAAKVGVVWKGSDNALHYRERNDADAPATWAADQILYSAAAMGSTYGWQHGTGLTAIGHANADFIMIQKLADDSLRIRRYVGGAWAADQTVATGVGHFSTRNTYWAERERLLFWPITTDSPKAWRVSDFAIESTTFDARVELMVPKVINDRWFGGSSGGSGGTAEPSLYEELLVYGARHFHRSLARVLRCLLSFLRSCKRCYSFCFATKAP